MNCGYVTVVLEKTLENPLDCKEIQLVHPKGNQSWIFIGRTDAEAETPILWLPDAKSWLIGKVPDAGKDWGQEEKGTTEDEMVGWHHWLNGHGFGWALGVGDGQGGLACCGSWGCKESDMTERELNWMLSGTHPTSLTFSPVWSSLKQASFYVSLDTTQGLKRKDMWKMKGSHVNLKCWVGNKLEYSLKPLLCPGRVIMHLHIIPFFFLMFF